MAKLKHIATISTALTVLITGVASASPLTFQGQNAALFPGANPSDTALMMSSTPRPTPDTNSNSNTNDLFVQEFSALGSNKIFNDIYGTSPQASGTQTAPNGDTITWNTISGVIHVTITDKNGQVLLSY